MKLTQSKLNHSLEVARKMQEIVLRNPNFFECCPEDAFYLGIVHDIGYEFVEDQTQHERVGGEILKKLNFKYWKEVYYHGNPNNEYDSHELMLLNYADLITGPYGEPMTIEERLEDIKSRYKMSSIQYKKAKKLSERINKTFIPNVEL